jgi:probable HAF family extracellular repeat protein
MRDVVTRAFFLILCACAGQTLLTPPAPPVADGQTALAGLAADGAALSLAIPNHPSSSEFRAINDLGEIAVDAGDGSATSGYVARPPYRPGDFERVDSPNASVTTVTGLNNGGMVVGFAADRRGNVAAFSERNGVWVRYAGPSSHTEYLGVNDGGTAVGFYTDRRGVDHAFSRDLGTGKTIRIHPGADDVTATAINDRGQIVGYAAAANGKVKGFVWQGGRFTEFTYPGAVETKPLGIAPNGEIVGTYVVASGKAHGFLLRDLTTTPRWKAFDEPNARGMTVLSGIDTRGDLVGYYRDKELLVRGLVCCASRRTGTVPSVIPVWGLGGDTTDTDPGATPDQHLFGVIEDSGYTTNTKLGENCPGVSRTSTCQPFKYVDFLYNSCNTSITLAAYQWADANDETAFQHIYPDATTESNRIEWDATPNPSGPNCKPDNSNASMRMNAGDSGYISYLYNNVWTGSSSEYDFPPPYGVLEDQASVFAGIVVGGSGQVSTEYGSGTKPSGFADQLGDSDYHAAMDWETALGDFVNGACASTCLNVAMNSVATGFGNVGACSIISKGHCHAQYQSGLIDNQANFDNICSTVTGGNLAYLEAERPIYAGRFGFEFLTSHTMTVEINTAANLYSHTTDGCANTKIVVLEPSYGEAGLGDIKGGYQVRLATLAYRFLVPNPATGIPDRLISFQLSEDETLTEVPYFFEDTLVPDGAETQVPKYAWNGTTVTDGGGCPSTDGDSGGAVSLLVECVGSSGIYCQQYKHLYINQTDYGKMAACLNTSTTAENITSSWFAHDPISSYNYVLSLQGGEMTSVPYQGVPGGSIALTTCTNKKYCTGEGTLATQVAPFKGNGTDQLCGQCGVILLEDN